MLELSRSFADVLAHICSWYFSRQTRMLIEIAKQWSDRLQRYIDGGDSFCDAVRIVVSYSSGYEQLVSTPDGAGDLNLRILFAYVSQYRVIMVFVVVGRIFLTASC